MYEARIEDMGREGDGLCRVDNFVVFVPGTKVGDTVKFRVTKVLRRVAFGEVVHEGAGEPATPAPAGDSKGVE